MTLDLLRPDIRKAAQRRLTHRQLQVLELVLLGHSDRAIARHLGIARSTARDHIQAILTKLRHDLADTTTQPKEGGRVETPAHKRLSSPVGVSAYQVDTDLPGPLPHVSPQPATERASLCPEPTTSPSATAGGTPSGSTGPSSTGPSNTTPPPRVAHATPAPAAVRVTPPGCVASQPSGGE